jgi:hypothetical protein
MKTSRSFELGNMTEAWMRYEEVRASGRYNMVMNARDAMAEAMLEEDEYFFVLKNYGALKKLTLGE